MSLPLIVAKVGVARPGCHNQVVVGVFIALGSHHLGPCVNDLDGYSMTTRTFWASFKMARMGWAMSAGESMAVATW